MSPTFHSIHWFLHFHSLTQTQNNTYITPSISSTPSSFLLPLSASKNTLDHTKIPASYTRLCITLTIQNANLSSSKFYTSPLPLPSPLQKTSVDTPYHAPTYTPHPTHHFSLSLLISHLRRGQRVEIRRDVQDVALEVALQPVARVRNVVHQHLLELIEHLALESAQSD